ncbi:MAG: hypothetical protein P8177_11020 [Gemmatimonadota bacterium]|jgi:hypothetical protein
MKPTLRWIALGLAALATAGCYKMDIDARDLEPHVYLTDDASPGESPQRVGEFEAETSASWALWGLVDLDEPDVAGALARAIADADGTAATNVSIVTQITFMDGFLAAITLGLYGRRTTFIEGTVVR